MAYKASLVHYCSLSNKKNSWSIPVSSSNMAYWLLVEYAEVKPVEIRPEETQWGEECSGVSHHHCTREDTLRLQHHGQRCLPYCCCSVARPTEHGGSWSFFNPFQWTRKQTRPLKVTWHLKWMNWIKFRQIPVKKQCHTNETHAVCGVKNLVPRVIWVTSHSQKRKA